MNFIATLHKIVAVVFLLTASLPVFGHEKTNASPASVVLDLGEIQVQTSGTTVKVPVKVSDFANVAGFQFSINWNSSELSFCGVEDLNPAFSNFGNSNFVPSSSNGFASDRLSVLWFDSFITGVSLADNSTLFNLCFQTSGLPGSVAPVQFSDSPTAREIVDSNGQPLPSSFQNGSVTVLKPLHLFAPIVGKMPGQQICLPVKLDNANQFSLFSFEFSMNWDAAVLQFTGVQNFGVPGMSGSDFGLAQTGLGFLPVGWSDPECNRYFIARPCDAF